MEWRSRRDKRSIVLLMFHVLKKETWDFPDGPVVKNPHCNAEDAGSIPDQGTKIPRAAGQLSPHTIMRVCAPPARSPVLQLGPDAAK